MSVECDLVSMTVSWVVCIYSKVAMGTAECCTRGDDPMQCYRSLMGNG